MIWKCLKKTQMKKEGASLEGQKVTEYKYKNATIRIHGTADQQKVKEAATLFLKKVEYQKSRKG